MPSPQLRDPALGRSTSRRGLLQLATCIAAVSTSHAQETAIPENATLVTHVRLTEERIEYRGIITQEANDAVFALYEEAAPKPVALEMESPGGSAAAAMELGAWVYSQRLPVHVATYCFSSCANYVFPAAPRKTLAPHAALMWHGGVTQPLSPEGLDEVLEAALADMSEAERSAVLSRRSREQLKEQLRASLASLIQRERCFFDVLGVDLRITMLGRLYERELIGDSGERYLGWDYSLDDLAKLGVRNVEVTGGAAWTPRSPIEGARIFRISLDRLNGFVPAPGARSNGCNAE